MIGICACMRHFKIDTLHSILKLVKKGCWMASVDLKDAYWRMLLKTVQDSISIRDYFLASLKCPVAKEHQKYLKFFWNNKYYKFTCFPNGLACCPRKFIYLFIYFKFIYLLIYLSHAI